MEGDEDLRGEDDGSEDEAVPLPPKSEFQSFQGYGNVGHFNQSMPLPPPAPPPPPSGDPPPMEFDSVANLSPEECREAMFQFVAENCCYGKGPAEKMDIGDIRPSTALHYELETFCEGRETGYAHEPFHGQIIDGPENGIPPPPWNIPCQPTSQFSDHDILLEVPHTATVRTCWKCHGSGQIRCTRCRGRGRVRCSSCHGKGWRRRHTKDGTEQRTCSFCHGSGRKRCFRCGGDGRVTCNLCKGHCQMKCFIRLTVKFRNHKSDYINETTDLPDELVRTVGGTVIFEQTMFQVWPIQYYPVQPINENSIRLVTAHRTAFPSERQLNQRQTLRAVPVTEVDYKYKDLNTRYWVYGRERKVYSPDYPAQCCWGCEIL